MAGLPKAARRLLRLAVDESAPIMKDPTLPFTVRYRKPFWLLICPDTGRTAVYGVYGQLLAHGASDALVSFTMENFVEIRRWGDVRGPMRPQQLADWMDPVCAPRCFLFALRQLETPTSTVLATPDR